MIAVMYLGNLNVTYRPTFVSQSVFHIRNVLIQHQNVTNLLVIARNALELRKGVMLTFKNAKMVPVIINAQIIPNARKIAQPV